MINKRIKHPLGTTEELPEGIFGLLSSAVPEPKLVKKSKRKIEAEAAALLAKPKKKKKRTGTAKSVVSSVPDVVKSKKKRKILPTVPETKAKTKTKTKPRKGSSNPKTRVMADFVINYDKTLPAEASGLPMDNVVGIPEELLDRITAKTQLNAKQLSNLMLLNAAPSVLSFDAASNYVRTVLDDGLGIEVEVDRGVLEVVKDLSRLDVVFFFLKRLALPMAFKRKFMQTFTDDMAKNALLTMQKTNKSAEMSQTLRELEGVLVKRSEHRARTHKSGGVLPSVEERVTDILNSKSPGGAAAVKRSRTTRLGNNSPAGF